MCESRTTICAPAACICGKTCFIALTSSTTRTPSSSGGVEGVDRVLAVRAHTVQGRTDVVAVAEEQAVGRIGETSAERVAETHVLGEGDVGRRTHAAGEIAVRVGLVKDRHDDSIRWLTARAGRALSRRYRAFGAAGALAGAVAGGDRQNREGDESRDYSSERASHGHLRGTLATSTPLGHGTLPRSSARRSARCTHAKEGLEPGPGGSPTSTRA